MILFKNLVFSSFSHINIPKMGMLKIEMLINHLNALRNGCLLSAFQLLQLLTQLAWHCPHEERQPRADQRRLSDRCLLQPGHLARDLAPALPEILVGLRIAVGFGWTTLVAAEMVAANVGSGQMVLNASNVLRTDIVIKGIIVTGVVAYLFDLLMRWIE